MSTEIGTILCATDFTPESDRAVDEALRLARSAEAKLIVVHLVHVSSGELASHDAEGPRNLTLPEARERARHRLEHQLEGRLGGHGEVELLVEFGAPAESLMTIARERGADIIVAAAHRHSELSDLLLGSVIEALTRQGPCPVLVVPPAS